MTRTAVGAENDLVMNLLDPEIRTVEIKHGNDGTVEGTGSQFSRTFENPGIYPVCLSLTDDYFYTAFAYEAFLLLTFTHHKATS